jgi:hypothetical protein
MAKRTRYSGRPTAKPGVKRPAQGTISRGSAAAASRIAGLTAAELERAAQIEAELVAREQAAIADNARRRARSGRVDVTITSDAGAPLSVRASHEYAYVARDVRRIGFTAGLMLVILAAIWLIVNLPSGGLA